MGFLRLFTSAGYSTCRRYAENAGEFFFRVRVYRNAARAGKPAAAEQLPGPSYRLNFSTRTHMRVVLQGWF